MKNKILTGVILTALPFIYLALVYNSLPGMVTINYTIHGHPGDTAPKSQTILFIGLLSFLTLTVFLTLTFVHKLVPKLASAANSGRLQNIALAVTGFLVCIQCWFIYTFRDGINTISLKFVLIALSLLFAIIGNYMPNLKPNYIAGYRIPWTLNNEDNWRKTHELAGKIWFFGGLLIMIVCIILPFETAAILFGVCLVVILVIPAIYSYKLHKKIGTFVL